MQENPDNNGDIINSLKSLGLTKYEALVYIALLKVEGATATEIHEVSGVPRASVYPVLDRLLQKNLVSVSHTTPKRFNATPPEEGIKNLLRSIEKDAEKSREVLSEIYNKRADLERGGEELIWSISGENNIRNRIIDLVSHAKTDVRIISNWDFIRPTILTVLDELDDTVTADIFTNCMDKDVETRANIHICVPPLISKAKAPETLNMAGIFIIDMTKVLVVMGPADVTPTALFSESPGFITFFEQYWRIIKSHLIMQPDSQPANNE